MARRRKRAAVTAPGPSSWPKTPKMPRTYKKSFFQLLPRIGFTWSHRAKPCDTDKVARFHIHHKHVESIMHAFRDIFPRNSKGSFDVAIAELVMGALESPLDIRKMSPMSFWPEAKAAGVSALLSHNRMTPEAAYDFVFCATNARQRFLKAGNRQQQIGNEGNLAKAIDSLVDQFKSNNEPRENTYLAHFRGKDWDPRADVRGISERTPPGQDSRPISPDIPARGGSDTMHIDLCAEASSNGDTPVDRSVEASSDDAMHIDPDMDSTSDDGMYIDPGVEDSSDDGMRIDPDVEDSSDYGMYIDPGVHDSSDDGMHLDPATEASSDNAMHIDPGVEAGANDDWTLFEPLQSIDIVVAPTSHPDETTVEDRLAERIGAMCIEDTEQALEERADLEQDSAMADPWLT